MDDTFDPTRKGELFIVVYKHSKEYLKSKSSDDPLFSFMANRLSNPLQKPEGIEDIVGLEMDIADPKLQSIASAVVEKELGENHTSCKIQGGWCWSYDNKLEEVSNEAFDNLGKKVREYLSSGKAVREIKASDVLTRCMKLIQEKVSEKRNFDPTESEKPLYQKFEELRDKVIEKYNQAQGDSNWWLPLYRDDEGNGFNLCGDGKTSIKFQMGGCDAGKCAPNNIWTLYREHLKREDLSRKEALEMAISKFEDLLSDSLSKGD